jgi:Protein of unknown function, DUF481
MKYFHILALLLPITASTQILNVESLRKVTDTSGWSGNAGFNFSLKRNVNDFVTFGSSVHVQYKTPKQLVLFKNDIAFEKISGESFDNVMVSHIRYNHNISPRVVWEVFTQAQYNKVNLIKFRGLAGTGPRFKLSKLDNYKFYLGALTMIEYEELIDEVTPIQRTIRASAYFSFSLFPSERITVVSTTYYQPRYDKVNDYRISSDSSLLVELFKNFSLKSTYLFIFDAFPAESIPKSQYYFLTGFAYSFD